MPHQQVRHPRVTQPSATVPRRTPFDLHVLGTPPAFTLSQDQTLHHECTSSLSLFETSLLRVLPQKESSACFITNSCFAHRLVAVGVHLRRSCSHLALLFLLFLWHVCIHRKPSVQVALNKCLCSTLLLFRYCQPRASKLLDQPIRLDNKKPESLSGGLGIPPQTCALPGLG